MDIHKEREAFEVHIKSTYPMGEQLAKDCGKTLCELYSSEWEAWQAAKAKAVPDGFVVVHIDALARAAQNIRELNNGEYYSEEIEENVCNIEAIIEAQDE